MREVDVETLLNGEVFRQLKDPDEFEKVHVDPETHTLTWPNGADLDPDVLYDPTLKPASGRRARVRVLSPR